MAAAALPCAATAWRISAASALIQGLFAAGWIAAAIGIVAANEVHEVDVYHSRMDVGLARIGCTIFTALGLAAYLYVGVKAVRPRQLHTHGLVLSMLIPETCLNLFGKEIPDGSPGGAMSMAAANFIFGVRKAILYRLVVQKLAALAAGPKCCLNDVWLWGRLLVASLIMVTFLGSGPIMLLVTILQLCGEGKGAAMRPAKEVMSQTGGEGISPVAVAMLRIFALIANAGTVGLLVSIIGLTVVAVRVSRAAMRMLLERQAACEELDKVRRTLRLHVLGVFLSITSTFLLFLGVGLDFGNIFDGSDLPGATYVADSTGDVAGIMLLSGIGVLLFREDPEAGDVHGQMRGLLHSAVLSSRADVVFEGHISPTPGQACVVSFPGRFLPEWHSLTWLCEQDRLSSACVFLPRSDPANRFGQHASCPELPGKCWCHQLYGTEKPWGCLWFTKWRGNVEKAVAEGLELVVVFFPQQIGQGIVEWSHLSTADLWDGIGLGGSQKAEVAFLRREGFKFVEEDVVAMRSRLDSIVR